MLFGVPAFGEFFDGFRAECVQIIGLAACYEALIDDDFFVDPVDRRRCGCLS